MEERKRNNLTLWVALFFVLVWGSLTHAHVGSFNDRSRMAAIESLVERGTWVIDQSPFSRTVDRILVDGHFYSDKPPVLTFIASGVYAVLHHGFHLSLDAGWCDPDADPCHCRAFCNRQGSAKPDWAYYLLTLLLVGFPSALTLALFYHLTDRFGLGNPAALLLTAALGLTTQIFPYSTVFNSHVPAAASLLAGFYALLRAREGERRDRWLFLSGFLTALAATFDLGVGLFFVAFLGYAFWGHRRRAWPYLAGGMLPCALMAILDIQIVGNPLPPYTYTQGYDYPGSRFPQTIAGNRSPENVLVYGLRLLLGDHGLFAFNPVLLWAVVALVQAWRAAPATAKMREAAALVGLTSGLFVLYFILSTDNFGGAAYGPRWYTVFIPLLFVFVAARWRTPAVSGKLALWGRRLLFVALASVSLVNSYQGALDPWRKATPLLWVERARPGWREPVDVALAGITFEEIEPDLRSAFAARRVDKRWFDARFCLVVPPGATWFFIAPGTPLDPVLAERSGLTSGGNLVRYADLRPVVDDYVERITISAWSSPAVVPAEPGQKEAVPLPASFGDTFAFLGYELLNDAPDAGAEVTLVTVWRIEGKPQPPLAIFVHLLDPRGRVAAQSDGLAANPDGLYPGDVLVHVHRFTVAADASPVRYWLQVGLYDPETMVRLPLTGAADDRLLLTPIQVAD